MWGEGLSEGSHGYTNDGDGRVDEFYNRWVTTEESEELV